MSDNEYTATMDELIDGYRAMRVQELAPVGPAFKRLLVSVEAVAEAHRALAAHDAEKDRQIAELRKQLEVEGSFRQATRELRDRAEDAEAQVAAAVALHKQVYPFIQSRKDVPACAACSKAPYWVEWPCPTVRALTTTGQEASSTPAERLHDLAAHLDEITPPPYGANHSEAGGQ